MKKIVAVVAACLASTAIAAPAQAAELLTNGNFETGTFAGWTVSTQAGSSGSLSLDTPGTTTPVAGFRTAANAAGGSFYAVTDQGGPGAYALTQAFTVAANTTALTLSFQMFTNNFAGQTFVGAQGLDYNGPNNQHVRVDVLRAGANPFSTAAADVVANLFLGGNTSIGPNPYVSYSYNIQPLVGAGNYVLRFGEVDNAGSFNLGVDNVSLDASIGAVPEPASWAMMIGGVGLVGGAMRRRKASVMTSVRFA